MKQVSPLCHVKANMAISLAQSAPMEPVLRKHEHYEHGKLSRLVRRTQTLQTDTYHLTPVKKSRGGEITSKYEVSRCLSVLHCSFKEESTVTVTRVEFSAPRVHSEA
jgi:hypothetical protein